MKADIARYRVARNMLPITEFAKHSGINYPLCYKIINSDYIPDVITFCLLLKILGTDFKDYFINVTAEVRANNVL
jgi:predicted transcriptional regulator